MRIYLLCSVWNIVTWIDDNYYKDDAVIVGGLYTWLYIFSIKKEWNESKKRIWWGGGGGGVGGGVNL